MIASRRASDRVLLQRAVLLARRMGAQLHLFYCESELPRTLPRQPNRLAELSWAACLADHLDYLRTLQKAAAAPDLQISVDAACSASLHAAVVRKIAEVRPALVLKSPAGSHPLRYLHLGHNDRDLLQRCPATLMLVRPRVWPEQPHLAALVDLHDRRSVMLSRTIVAVAAQLAEVSGGQLSLVYSEQSSEDGRALEREQLLRDLALDVGVEMENAHLLSGDPHKSLRSFLDAGRFDAIVMGATTHRWGVAAVTGTLTSRLVDTYDGDVVLVHDPGKVRSAAVRGTSPIAAGASPEVAEVVEALNAQRMRTLAQRS
jgi:universal stress protein E